tara:strand:- start:452 stop:814 length:363 start_codon:yes stop_codon:yes gene_type:complete
MLYKDKETLIVVFKILILTILSLVFLFIGKTCSNSYQSPDITGDQIKIDSLYSVIAYKEIDILNLKVQSQMYTVSIDSLNILVRKIKSSKARVKTKYEKIYIFVDHATNNQLDSTIRANW